uniref:Uncharacterized protein n=1 Tax=Anguilla anguilla TaxID=7936 RepID=A0A0E9S017_ANGAN
MLIGPSNQHKHQQHQQHQSTVSLWCRCSPVVPNCTSRRSLFCGIKTMNPLSWVSFHLSSIGTSNNC